MAGVTQGDPEPYRYRHFGITLQVNERLPRLTEAAAADPDVTVQFLDPGQPATSELTWECTSPSVWRAPASDGSWLRLRYEFEDDWADFVVDGRGANIWIARSPNVAVSEVAELLLGPIFSCVASQRGLTCLHASVVHLKNRVIALMGPSGAGKSTTALALGRWGDGDLVSDDVAILSDRDEQVTVAIGPPRIRMRAAPAMSLLGQFDSLEPVWDVQRPVELKRYLPISSGLAGGQESALPLNVIYVLLPYDSTTTEPRADPVEPVSALPLLMANRHMLQTTSSDSTRRDFERLARLLRTAPARKLIRPSGLESTEQIARAIIGDVGALA